MASSRKRKCCDCNEELSHAAYYRHLKDTTGDICIGKQALLDENQDVSDSLSWSSFDNDLKSSTDIDRDLTLAQDQMMKCQNTITLMKLLKVNH